MNATDRVPTAVGDHASLTADATGTGHANPLLDEMLVNITTRRSEGSCVADKLAEAKRRFDAVLTERTVTDKQRRAAVVQRVEYAKQQIKVPIRLARGLL